MRQTIKYEFWVGLFLLLGIASLIFLGLKVANVQGFSDTKSAMVLEDLVGQFLYGDKDKKTEGEENGAATSN